MGSDQALLGLGPPKLLNPQAHKPHLEKVVWAVPLPLAGFTTATMRGGAALPRQDAARCTASVKFSASCLLLQSNLARNQRRGSGGCQ